MSAHIAQVPKEEIQNLQKLREDFKNSFICRDEEIDMLLVSLLAQEHCLLLGDPGTAKSELGKAFSKCLGLKTWSIQLMRTTKPDDVFGGLSLPDYENGVVKRITDHKLPSAEFAILDEIFKCNSAILNGLLEMLNERVFHNPEPLPIPLQMVVAMSNEGPDGGSDGELGAFYDRFLMRTWVQPLKTKLRKLQLLQLKGDPGSDVRVSMEEINGLRSRVKQCTISKAMMLKIIEIEELVTKEQIVVSNRRLRKSMKMAKACAVLNGRDEVVLTDLSVLKHMFWNEKDELKKVHQIVYKVANNDVYRANKAYDTAKKIHNEVIAKVELEGATWSDYGTSVIEAQTQLKKLHEKVFYLDQNLVSKQTTQIRELGKQLKALSDKQLEF